MGFFQWLKDQLLRMDWLSRLVRTLLENGFELQAEVVKITDVAQIAAHGVMSTPALVINDTVVSAGKVLSSEEISRLLPIN